MPQNKPRLCIVLWARNGTTELTGKETEFHWSLATALPQDLVKGSGSQQAVRLYHLTDNDCRPPFQYESRLTPLGPEDRELTRIVVAKVKDMDTLRQSLDTIAVRQDPDFNCVEWVKDALREVNTLHNRKRAPVLGTKSLFWEKVKRECLKYTNDKKSAGRWNPGKNSSTVPTYDLLQRKELVA